MSYILTFIGGMMAGSVVGIFVMCLCAAAGRSDQMDEYRHEKECAQEDAGAEGAENNA